MSAGTRTDEIENSGKDRLMDRRGMLTAVAATAAGLVGALAVPGAALAATGDVAHTGWTSDATGADDGLWGRNLNLGTGGVGVRGESASGDGIVAYSTGNDKSGIWAKNISPGGAGVTGDGAMAGVYGRTLLGNGVQGTTTAAGKSGAYGYNTHASGNGVFGEAVGGVGVRAKSATGSALKVEGKTAFTRSGITSIAKKSTSVTITVPGGVTPNSKFLVTLQGSLGSGVNIWCAYAVGTTAFKVKLNKKATRKASVAWIVLD